MMQNNNPSLSWDYYWGDFHLFIDNQVLDIATVSGSAEFKAKKYAMIGVVIAYNNESAFTDPAKEKCMTSSFLKTWDHFKMNDESFH